MKPISGRRFIVRVSSIVPRRRASERRDRLGEEHPDVTAIAGARAFERGRHPELAARRKECERIARPAFVVEVDGEEAARLVEQQRIDAGDEVTPAVVPHAIFAAQMALDHLVA